MGSSLWKTPVLVIADDFTGANDAGSGLAQAGARVHVLFGTEAPLPDDAADVLVISTDSRAVRASTSPHSFSRAGCLKRSTPRCAATSVLKPRLRCTPAAKGWRW